MRSYMDISSLLKWFLFCAKKMFPFEDIFFKKQVKMEQDMSVRRITIRYNESKKELKPTKHRTKETKLQASNNVEDASSKTGTHNHFFLMINLLIILFQVLYP